MAEIVYVSPLNAIDRLVDQQGVRHLMTLINGETPVATPDGVRPDNHLRLIMNDIDVPIPGLIHPTPDHVGEIIDFARTWDRQAPMLIHCWAGISRSTAAAFTLLCALNPGVSEQRLAEHLRQASPSAYPNRLIVRHADEALERRGRMVEAIDGIGRGEIVMEGVPFALQSSIAAES